MAASPLQKGGKTRPAERVRRMSPLGVGGKPVPVFPGSPLSPLRKGAKPLQLHCVGPYPTSCLQRAVRSEVFVPFKPRSGLLPTGNGCARAAEDKEWQKWAAKWSLELSPVLRHSPSFVGLDGELATASLLKILQRSAAGTLRKHFPGWRLWQSFASDHDWNGVSFSQSQLVLFLQALAEAGHGAASCAGSLRFVAGILGHQRWIDHFADPVVKAWCSSNTRKVAKKEALPLPLHVVADLEASVCSDVVSGMSADTMLVCGFLIMIWGSLRFSDAQRIDVAGLTLENGLLRGECWRTKSSSCGMPFGVLTMGICHNWSGAVAAVMEQMAGCDFLLCGRAGQPASFACTLMNFRRLLVQRAQVPVEMVSSYTLHSMKATGLSWALQVGVDAVSRRVMGHHRARDSGERMAGTYSRDDVLLGLRAQLKILRAIRRGWCPLTPQGRGGKTPLAEAGIDWCKAEALRIPSGLDCNVGETSDTESDVSEGELSDSSSSCSSGASVVSEPLQVVASRGEQFVVNRLTHCFHRAVNMDGRVGRACNPAQHLHATHWEIWSSDPAEEMFLPCAHSACA